MKRSLAVLVSILLFAAACAVTAPGAPGVVTKVDNGTVTVAATGGAETTYTIGRNTNVYSPDGVLTQRSYLTPGQRVLVWSNGANAVRINIEP